MGILGPLLFNIFIYDLLFFNISSKIYNYSDDNKLFYTSSDINEVKIKLEEDCLKSDGMVPSKLHEIQCRKMSTNVS